MARIKGPRKVSRYTAEFKLKAVKLSQIDGVRVQDVADALEIHPFMLSRWRKLAREGRIRYEDLQSAAKFAAREFCGSRWQMAAFSSSVDGERLRSAKERSFNWTRRAAAIRCFYAANIPLGTSAECPRCRR